MHDISTGRGNIDHVAIGPGGMLTIETKSRRGRMRVDAIDGRWLRQAYAERKWLEGITNVPCECLLVISGAYLDRAPCRRKGVLILPARMLAGHLARRKTTLDREQVTKLHGRIAAALDAGIAAAD